MGHFNRQPATQSPGIASPFGDEHSLQGCQHASGPAGIARRLRYNRVELRIMAQQVLADNEQGGYRSLQLVMILCDHFAISAKLVVQQLELIATGEYWSESRNT